MNYGAGGPTRPTLDERGRESTPRHYVFKGASCLASKTGRGESDSARGGRRGSCALPARGPLRPGAGRGPPRRPPAESRSQAPGSEFKWSWGNTVSYGLGYRLGDPDQRLIGLAAGGTAYLGQRRRRHPELRDGDLHERRQAHERAAVELQGLRRLRARLRLLRLRERDRRPGAHPALRTTPRTASAAGSSSATLSSTAASSSGGCRASSARATRSSTGVRAPSSRGASTRSTRST